MIKTISYWAFEPSRSLPEAFQMAREAGFEAIELAIAEDGPITPDISRQECRKITAQARDAGLQISSLASGLGWKYGLLSENESERRRATELTRSSLRVARDLELDAILVVPGSVGATPYDLAFNNAQNSLRELKLDAEELGVTIGIENVWNKFLLSPLETRDFLDGLGSERIASYFDVGNVLQTGFPEQWIRMLGGRITRVHFKDFQREVGTLAGFCALGEGDVDFGAVMQALREIGYDGFVTAEFFNCESDLGTISAAMDRILSL